MEKFSYLLFIFVFSVPALLVLFFRYKKQIAKRKAYVVTSVLVGSLLALISDPVGIRFGAWAYDWNKSLGTTFTGAAIETVLLGIAMSLFFAIIVLVFAEREEKKKPFWPL